MDSVLTLQQVAEYLSVSPKRVRRLSASGVRLRRGEAVAVRGRCPCIKRWPAPGAAGVVRTLLRDTSWSPLA